jgi:hypothetical protein
MKGLGKGLANKDVEPVGKRHQYVHMFPTESKPVPPTMCMLFSLVTTGQVYEARAT